MKKLPLQLEERLVCYCHSFMASTLLDDFFEIARDISIIVKTNSFTETDLVPFEIDPEKLVNMYKQLGARVEYLFAGIHRELKAALIDQLTTLSQSEDEEIVTSVGYVHQMLTERDTEIDNTITALIQAGREKLLK